MDEKFSFSKVMAQPVHVFYTEVFSDRISTRVVPVLSLYRNQSIDLLCKSIDWFLYEGNTGDFRAIHSCSTQYQVNIYRLIGDNRNGRKRCELSSKLIIKTAKQRRLRCFQIHKETCVPFQ